MTAVRLEIFVTKSRASVLYGVLESQRTYLEQIREGYLSVSRIKQLIFFTSSLLADLFDSISF